VESSDIAGCTWVTAPHPQPLLLISILPCRSAARPLAWLSRAKAAHTAGKQPYRAHDQPLIFLAHLPEQRLVVAVVRLVDRRNPLASRGVSVKRTDRRSAASTARSTSPAWTIASTVRLSVLVSSSRAAARPVSENSAADSSRSA